ncbi:hypothetical protein, partial [Candidatus Methylobacter favarea]|uniref:hypothetical protein n=1 Tax=Candidatus Methylobacter favarea TaxID=2707345 RepID=UPI001C2DB503
TNSACVGGAKTPGGTMTIWLIYSSDAQKSQCQQKTVLMRNPCGISPATVARAGNERSKTSVI